MFAIFTRLAVAVLVAQPLQAQAEEKAVPDFTGRYLVSVGKDHVEVFVLQGDAEVVLDLRAMSAWSCRCWAQAPASGKNGFGPSEPFGAMRVEGDALVVPFGASKCCPKAPKKVNLRLERGGRGPLEKCAASARKAYFYNVADQKRRGAYVVSGDRLEAFSAFEHWLAARFVGSSHRTVGLVRSLDVDCHAPPVGSGKVITLPYRMTGSLDQGPKTYEMKCSGEALVTATADEDGESPCYAWQPRNLSCEGTPEPDWLGNQSVDAPHVCRRDGTWQGPELIARSGCANVQVEERDGVLSSMKVTCRLRCPDDDPCTGVATYEFGRQER